MPRLTLTGKKPSTLKVDALVVAVAAGPDGPELVDGVEPLPRALAAEVLAAAPALGVTGAADEVRRIPTAGRIAAPVLVLTGLGRHRAGDDLEALRRAAGAATRELAGVASVGLALPASTPEEVAAVAEGALLGAYAFTRYQSAGGPGGAAGPAGTARPVAAIELATGLGRNATATAAAERAHVLADAVHGVRDLVNTPPADLYPEAFAQAAREAVRGTGVKITVLDEAALADGGYGGLIGVGQGSVRPPRLVKVAWSPSRAAKRVALVGKGITFDSGGLSIKNATGMVTMKCDMAGAAAVLHTVVAAARLELPVKVTGWLCLAENMPSATAQRPSDVITIRGGRTVEVLNTDAEGRLVLADGLVAATEEKPDVVVDIATLTGAQVVALGSRVAAVMGTDDARAQVVEASQESGEPFWPMPLPEDLRPSLKSSVADIANIGDRNGGMLVAGLFLREFVGTTPWAHLDIAGPAFNEGTARDYTPVGGTGAGVRTLLTLLERTARRR